MRGTPAALRKVLDQQWLGLFTRAGRCAPIRPLDGDSASRLSNGGFNSLKIMDENAWLIFEQPNNDTFLKALLPPSSGFIHSFIHSFCG